MLPADNYEVLMRAWYRDRLMEIAILNSRTPSSGKLSPIFCSLALNIGAWLIHLGEQFVALASPEGLRWESPASATK